MLTIFVLLLLDVIEHCVPHQLDLRLSVVQLRLFFMAKLENFMQMLLLKKMLLWLDSWLNLLHFHRLISEFHRDYGKFRFFLFVTRFCVRLNQDSCSCAGCFRQIHKNRHTMPLSKLFEKCLVCRRQRRNCALLSIRAQLLTARSKLELSQNNGLLAMKS